MPFKSKAQKRYFNANRAMLEAQGVNVAEWNKASKGKKLPYKADHNQSTMKYKIKDASKSESKNAIRPNRVSKGRTRKPRKV